MKSKLNIDPKVVDSARQHAANIAHDMQEFIERHTTVSTERTIVRLLGIDGVDELETPLPNVVVDHIKDAGALPTGAAYWIGNAIVQTGKQPQEIAEEIAAGKLVKVLVTKTLLGFMDELPGCNFPVVQVVFLCRFLVVAAFLKAKVLHEDIQRASGLPAVKEAEAHIVNNVF